MAIKLQIRRGTAADWAAGTANPTLLEGEIGYETDTGNFKVGDGTRAWNDLPYQMPYFTGTKPTTNTSTTRSRIVVDQTNDRVGIGTSTPLDKLHIEGSSPIIRLRDTDSGAGIYSQINANATDGTLVISADANNASGTTGASKIQFAVDNTTQVTVTKDTQVGIGTPSPASSLHIVSPTTTADINLVNSGTTGGSGGLVVKSTNNDAFITNVENADLRLGTNNTDRVTIDSAGEVGIGTTTPLSLLHLESTAPVIRFRDTASAASTHSTISADNADGTITINADAGNNTGTSNVSKIQFVVDGTTTATVLPNEFGIGTANPLAELHVESSAPSIIIRDSDGAATAYGEISSDNTGRVTIAADPNNVAGSSSVRLSVDNTTRIEATASGATITGTCTATTFSGSGASLTADTIPLASLIDIATAGGALLGRTTTGAVQEVSKTNVSTWLALGSIASETKTDYYSEINQIGCLTFGWAQDNSTTEFDFLNLLETVAITSGGTSYYLRPKSATGGTWTLIRAGTNTSGDFTVTDSPGITSSTANNNNLTGNNNGYFLGRFLFIAIRTA
jgi:hypothetical protein